MPVTSVRDIVVHSDDLAIATHGRGFWVMDQMTPLREVAAQGPQIVSSNVWLFKPGETWAVRPGSMNGTPMPHDEPQGKNPPNGVVVYYSLKGSATQPLKLELLNSAGAVRACAASDTPVRPVNTETINVEAVWEQPEQPPSAAAGMHRFAIGGVHVAIGAFPVVVETASGVLDRLFFFRVIRGPRSYAQFQPLPLTSPESRKLSKVTNLRASEW